MFINEIVSVYSFIQQTFIINVYYVPGSSQEEEKRVNKTALRMMLSVIVT